MAPTAAPRDNNNNDGKLVTSLGIPKPIVEIGIKAGAIRVSWRLQERRIIVDAWKLIIVHHACSVTTGAGQIMAIIDAGSRMNMNYRGSYVVCRNYHYSVPSTAEAIQTQALPITKP